MVVEKSPKLVHLDWLYVLGLNAIPGVGYTKRDNIAFNLTGTIKVIGIGTILHEIEWVTLFLYFPFHTVFDPKHPVVKATPVFTP